MIHTQDDLRQFQALPLDVKVLMTIERIRTWVNEFGSSGVYISFSGGKDSTVLMDIIRNRMGYNIPAVFVDVPTQYPELRDFAKTWDNVEIVKPKISFMEVCETYGFPLISKEVAQDIWLSKKWLENKEAYKNRKPIKVNEGDYEPYAYVKLKGGLIGKHGEKSMFNNDKWFFMLEAPFTCSDRCCFVMKKAPIHEYEARTGRVPILATLAEESRLRKEQWIKHGCNSFNAKRPISNPMSFWTEQDVLKYIKENDLPICSVYGNVVYDESETEDIEGQMKLYDNGQKLKCSRLQRTGCMLCGFGCHLDKGKSRFELLHESHPKMYNLLDLCKNNGVTFREAIEWTNEHGNLNIKL